MANTIKPPKSVEENFSETRRKIEQQRLAAQKKVEDEDDESGGGAGKRKQHSYKLENLLKVIEKGKLKARAVGKFLLSEGLDTNEIKKSELGLQKEEAVKAAEQPTKEEMSQISKERSVEVKDKATAEKETAKENKASWDKARVTTAQRFGLINNRLNANIADATNRAAIGNLIHQNKDLFGKRTQTAQQIKAREYINSQKSSLTNAEKFVGMKGTTFSQTTHSAPEKSSSASTQTTSKPSNTRHR